MRDEASLVWAAMTGVPNLGSPLPILGELAVIPRPLGQMFLHLVIQAFERRLLNSSA